MEQYCPVTGQSASIAAGASMFMMAVSAYAKWGTNGSGMLGMAHRHGIKLLILFTIISVYIGNCAMIDSGGGDDDGDGNGNGNGNGDGNGDDEE